MFEKTWMTGMQLGGKNPQAMQVKRGRLSEMRGSPRRDGGVFCYNIEKPMK